MVGILVHGNNHFILSGPVPDKTTALALVRHWSIIRIGETKSLYFDQWEIKLKEFRENLEWAVVVPGEGEVSPGVAQLLGNFPLAALASGGCPAVADNSRVEQQPQAIARAETRP